MRQAAGSLLVPALQRRERNYASMLISTRALQCITDSDALCATEHQLVEASYCVLFVAPPPPPPAAAIAPSASAAPMPAAGLNPPPRGIAAPTSLQTTSM